MAQSKEMKKMFEITATFLDLARGYLASIQGDPFNIFLFKRSTFDCFHSNRVFVYHFVEQSTFYELLEPNNHSVLIRV